MFRKILVTSLVLISLLMGSLLAVIFFVPTEVLKTQVLGAVEKSTGQRMEITGDLKWQILPSLRLHATGLRLFNDKSFNDEPFITIQEADIVLALAPLLRKQVDIKTFILISPEVHLLVNDKGVSNWEHFFNKQANQASLGAPPSSTDNNPPEIFKSLGQIQIKGGLIDYQNVKDKKKFKITPLELSLKPKGLAMAMDGSMRASLDGQTYFLRLSSMLKGDINALNYSALNIEGTVGSTSWVLSSEVGAISFKETSLKTPHFKLKLNEDRMSGEALITLNPLKVKLIAQGKTLNLDNLSKQASMSQQHSDKNKASSKDPSFKSLQASLKEGSIDVHLSWDEIIKQGLKFDTVAVDIGSFEGAFIVKTKAELQGGLFKSEHMVSFASDTALIHHRGQFKQIPVQSLLQQVMNVRALQGQGYLTFDVTTKGLNKFIDSATGKITLDIAQGSLSGIDLAYYFAQAKALRRQQSLEEREKKSDTMLFDTLSTRITVRGGVLNHDSIHLKSKDFGMEGTGQLNLINHAISYQLRATDLHKPEGPPLAIIVRGSIEHPQVMPDLETYVRYFVERELKRQLMKVIAPEGAVQSDTLQNTEDGTSNVPALTPEKVLKQLFKF